GNAEKAERARMRVLVLSREYPPETAWGGIATYARAHALALRTLGHDVTVISASAPGSRDSLAERDGIPVYRIADAPLRAPIHRRSGEVVRWSQCARALAASLGRFDAVEAPDFRGEGIAFARARLGDAPLVVRLHAPLALVSAWNGEATTRS